MRSARISSLLRKPVHLTSVGAVLLTAMLSSTSLQAAGVYRWTDRNGVVHYDDTSSAGQKLTRDFLEDRDIPAKPEWEGVIPGELIAEVEQRCAHAKERLVQYRSAPEIYGRDPSGNVYRLSPNQARLMVGEIQTEATHYCRPDAPRRVFAERRAAAKLESERPRKGG